MKIKLYIAIFLIALLGYTKSTSNYKDKLGKESGPTSFPKFKSQFFNKEKLSVSEEPLEDFRLDSLQYSNWTDNYTHSKLLVEDFIPGICTPNRRQ